MAASEPFAAFLSYSRGASEQLAVDLQAGLERFAKPWYRLRAIRVFRDDSSMSANTALWSTIQTGLTQSAWFVLLATPASAASPWVAQEIDWWLQHKGPQRLLIVQAEGDLYWDRVARAFSSIVDRRSPRSCTARTQRNHAGSICAGMPPIRTAARLIPGSPSGSPTCRPRCAVSSGTLWSGRTYASTGGRSGWPAARSSCCPCCWC